MFSRYLLIILSVFVISSQATHAQKPEFFVDIWRYQQLRNNSYEEFPKIEVYLRVPGSSLNYVSMNQGMKRAAVHVDMEIFRIEPSGDSLKLHHERLELNGKSIPEEDGSSARSDIHYKQEFQLPRGNYHMSISVQDVNAPSALAGIHTRDFIMPPSANSNFAFSDISFLEAVPKPERLRTNEKPRLGKFFTPLITNNALINQDTLIVYVQLYNLPRLVTDGDVIERARIIRQGKNVKKPYEDKEIDPENYQIFIHSFDIRDLFSDTYHIVVELVDEKTQKILRSTSKKFYVYNSRQEPDFEQFVNVYAGDLFKEYDDKTLTDYIQKLAPISNKQEIRFAGVLRTYEQKRNYLYSFWNRRTQEGESVMDLWKGYLAALEFVNDQYGLNNKAGWETDRGKIMLTYGAPNDIEYYYASPTTRAHEIWRYDRLDNQTNVNFVFYPEKKDSRDFKLLHSDKYGEINNPRWRSELEFSSSNP